MGHFVPWGNNLNASPRQQQAEPPLPPPLSSLHHQTSPTPALAPLSLQAASPHATRMSCWLSRHGFSAAALPFFPNTPPGAFQQPPRRPLAPRLKVRTQLPAAPCPALPAHTHPSGALSQGKGKEETTRCQGKRAKRPSAGPTAPAACPQQAQPVPQEPQFTPQFVPTLLGAPGAA